MLYQMYDGVIPNICSVFTKETVKTNLCHRFSIRDRHTLGHRVLLLALSFKKKSAGTLLFIKKRKENYNLEITKH
jgi:hypothetical protein